MSRTRSVHRELRRLGRHLNRRLGRHPDDGRLRLYALGELCEPDRLRTLLHLDVCPHCRERLARLEVAPDWSTMFEGLQSRLPARPGPSRELLERVRGWFSEIEELWSRPAFTPIPVAVTRSGSAYHGEFQKAMEPYTDGDPDGAVRSLEEHLDRYPGDHQALFYLGASHLERGEVALAAQVLGEAVECSGMQAPPRYRWSLVEALLLTGELERARTLLQGFKFDGGPWDERAFTVMETLVASS